MSIVSATPVSVTLTVNVSGSSVVSLTVAVLGLAVAGSLTLTINGQSITAVAPNAVGNLTVTVPIPPTYAALFNQYCVIPTKDGLSWTGVSAQCTRPLTQTGTVFGFALSDGVTPLDVRVGL